MKKIQWMAGVVFVFCLSSVFGQGSLTPPGAPAPTMKTLNEIDAAVAGVSNQVEQLETEPRIPISVPGYVISAPGSYYLTANLEPSGAQKGVTISSSDVTLDLNGFVINGSGASSSGINISSSYENVLIKNGVIRDCYHQAIYATIATGCSFMELRVSGNTRFSSAYSALYIGSGSVVEGCRIENNTGNGISAKGDSRIVGNRIVGNGGAGLKLTGSGSHVTDNIVKGNADNYDFAAGNQLNLLLCEIPETIDWPCSVKLAGTLECSQTGVDGITVAANDVTINMDGHALVGPGASSGHGISQDTAYRNLRVFNGKASGWRGTGRAGFQCRGDNSIVDNLQATTNSTGISIGTGGTIALCTASGNRDGFVLGGDCTVTDSKALDNTDWGFLPAAGTKISSCTITGNGAGGVALSLACQIQECIIQENVDGILATTECVIRNNTVVNNSGNGIELTADENLIEDNVVKGNGDNYVFADGNQLNLLLCEIPETIDWPCSVKLAGSLSGNGHGVVITANGVTLDLMGFSLSGDGGSGDNGIFVDGATNRVVEHVVVRNGAVKNFGSGILAEYSLGGRFEQLALFDNTFYGVYLLGDSGPCDGNTITDCTISEYGEAGVYLDGVLGQCDGNTIAGCFISGNDGNGVHLNGYSGQCDGNAIADCIINGKGLHGIYLSYADGNRVEGNHVTGQTDGVNYGVRCNSTKDNLFIRNTCVGHTVNFSFDLDDTYGPVVSASGELSTTGAAAHPLANFSF